MHKTLGDVGQVSLRPIMIMSMTTTTAFLCMESVLRRFLHPENDIRYNLIDTRCNTLCHFYSGLVLAITHIFQMLGFTDNRDKTGRSLQDGMSHISSDEKT